MTEYVPCSIAFQMQSTKHNEVSDRNRRRIYPPSLSRLSLYVNRTGIIWTLTILRIVMISVRFYVRSVMLRALGSDDWFMLVAVVYIPCLQKLALNYTDAACLDSPNRMLSFAHRGIRLGLGQA